MTKVILTDSRICFENGSGTTFFDLTEEECKKLYSIFYAETKKLDKHRGYYDVDAPVHITKVNTHLKYSCEIQKYIVYDKISDRRYEMLKEDEAKQIVDMLRDKYRS